jgi:hypothetical protein
VPLIFENEDARRAMIFYRPLSDGIEIVRVLHGARDIDSLFHPDEDPRATDYRLSAMLFDWLVGRQVIADNPPAPFGGRSIR